MSARYSRYIPMISLVGDFVLLNLFFVAGYCLLYDSGNCFLPRYLMFYGYLNLVWFTLVFSFGAHKVDRNTRKKSLLFVYIRIIVFFFFFFLMYFQLTPLSYYPRDHIGQLFVFFFGTLMSWKFGLYYAFVLYRKWGFNYRTVIILGDTSRTRELAQYFTVNRWHGYRLLGFFDGGDKPAEDLLGGWDDLVTYVRSTHVDEIYLASGRVPDRVMPVVTQLVNDYPVKVRVVPDLGPFTFKSTEMVPYGSTPVIQINPGPLSYWYNRLVKRVLDVAVSLLVIVLVMSWMMPLLYVVQLLTGGDGLFFRQRRTRIDGREFTCLKFRTMRRNAAADSQQCVSNDPRVTSMGRYLRLFSLDELPQFFNVLAGQMSVVGPRPHMLRHTEEYRKLVRRFMLRHTVKPGITGLAQVNGCRGEIKNHHDIKNRVMFDIQYIENWSFNLDIRIMLMTIWLIIRGRLKGA